MPQMKTRSLRRLRRTPLLLIVPLLALLAVMTLGGGGPGRAGNTAASGFDHALDATLVLREDDEGRGFLGSATLWGDGDRVVTAAHVVKDRRSVIVEDRHGRSAPAQVIASDPRRDISVLALATTMFGPGLVPGSGGALTGDEVFALGAPLQAAGTVTRGIVSVPARQVEPNVPLRLIQHDAAINPGSSGGPLIGADGRLVGINTRIADGTRLFAGIGYAIPVAALSGMVAGKLSPVPDLGLALRPVTGRIARLIGLETPRGVLVDHVESRGRGWRAGVAAGDVLLSLAGRPIMTPGDLGMILGEVTGGTARLVIWRAGSEIAVPLDLDPRPAETGALGAAPAGLQRVQSYGWAGLGVTLAPGTRRVAALTQTSPAWAAGLAEGDEIEAVNGTEVTALSLAAERIDGPRLLRVLRHGRRLHVMVDPWATRRPDVPRSGANALDPAVVVF
ncbi:serine protease [Pseudooceanicola nanhaiensis]|uniref:Serine protease n=2 Tax=Pseudooceanicola nanhaiensis TaxID=375761 RepID=A0A917WHI2_9RHOB|nr:trypsin-like peptidase domain-containing protein [Pseudooceanicola nanhaiensis]GGM03749.1 serine protease [Pseudooceanicola nanhaiensis]